MKLYTCTNCGNLLYFENNICNCLQFTPGSVTSGILKKFSCSIRYTTGGFALYANVQGTPVNWLTYITNVMGVRFFDFTITTTNAAFAFFTDVPVNSIGRLDYNSSNSANITGSNGMQLAETFVNATAATALGTITICFDDIIKQQLAGSSAPFIISYKARSTQWQYYIINKSAVRMDNPCITSKDGIVFSGPEKVTTGNGEQALLFSSGDTLLPLSEVPKYVFGLSNNALPNNTGGVKKTSPAKTIYKGLPNPDPLRVGITANGANSVSSPMYVYI